MITKSGHILCRTQYSKCEYCKYYFTNKKYACWYSDYINFKIWCGFESCPYFESTINQLNNEFVFRDYELVPIKEYSNNKYRFNSKGERI